MLQPVLYYWLTVCKDYWFRLKKEAIFFRQNVCCFEYFCENGRKILINPADISQRGLVLQYPVYMS